MTDKSKTNAIAQLIGTRAAAIEAVVLALTFGLGVNILSSFLVDIFKSTSSFWLLFISLICIVGSVIWLYKRVSSSVCLEQRWEGIIGIEPASKNNFIDLIVYPFSRDIHRLIQATIKGDPELLKSWQESKIMSLSPAVVASRWYGKILAPNKPLPDERSNIATQLIEEASEVIVFYAISDSLARFSSKLGSASWKYLTINDLLPVIDKNRVLKKISTGSGDGAGYVIDSSGLLQMDAKVMVPNGCTLSRMPSGEILLKTPRISIAFKVDFSSIRHFELPEFSTLYLNREPQSTELFKIFISTRLTIPTRRMWNLTEWWEREWMEELMIEFQERIDFPSFKTRVNFEAALVARRLQVVYESKKVQ